MPAMGLEIAKHIGATPVWNFLAEQDSAHAEMKEKGELSIDASKALLNYTCRKGASACLVAGLHCGLFAAKKSQLYMDGLHLIQMGLLHIYSDAYAPSEQDAFRDMLLDIAAHAGEENFPGADFAGEIKKTLNNYDVERKLSFDKLLNAPVSYKN